MQRGAAQVGLGSLTLLSVIKLTNTTKMQKGIDDSRSDDTKALKSAIIDFIKPPGHNLEPYLARNVRTGRGFHHPVTGRYLCPVGMDWSDPEYVNMSLYYSIPQSMLLDMFRIQTQLRERLPPGDDWPLFLYKGCKYDSQNPWEGLFEGELIVKVSFPFH